MDVQIPHHNRERCAIAIMAKAPVAGRVKTRLSPFLSPAEAHNLSCCFLRDITANLALAASSAPIDAYVAFAPAGTEAAFDGLLTPGTGLLLADGSRPGPPGIRGFGSCLHQAACALVELGYCAVGLLNSDSPNLPTARLIEAARLMARPGERVVLGPASDGGYYLLMMKAPHAALFRDIEWSTSRVADQTRAGAKRAGLTMVELDPWYDVDDAGSLCALVRDLQSSGDAGSSGYAARATAHFLRTAGIADRLTLESMDAGR